jgi:hypothetical protein
MMALAVAWLVVSGLITLAQVYLAGQSVAESYGQAWRDFLITAVIALLFVLYALAAFLLAARTVFQLAGA